MEIYKTLNDLNPTFMKEVFFLKEHNYSTRKQNLFYPNPRTVSYGIETLGYKASEIWGNIPKDIQDKRYPRLSYLMSIRQRKTIMNAFINSQFSYCPLIWMCHSRTTHSLINNIHEIVLRIVYNDNNSPFAQLLEKGSSVTIHQKFTDLSY